MTPLLMWVFPTPFLIPIVMCSEVFGGVLLARHWKMHVADTPRFRWMLLFAAVFLPLGIYIGQLITPIILKLLASSVILFFATYLLLQPHIRVASSWALDGIAGALSGLLLGSCGIGGPPAALYLNSTEDGFDRMRSLLSHFVSGISVLAIISASMMGGGFGWVFYLSVAIPFYWLGMSSASRVLAAHAMADTALKKLCLLLLIGNASLNLLFLLISNWV